MAMLVTIAGGCSNPLVNLKKKGHSSTEFLTEK